MLDAGSVAACSGGRQLQQQHKATRQKWQRTHPREEELRLVVLLHKFHITEGDAESTEVMPFTEMRYFSGLGTVIVTCCPRGRFATTAHSSKYLTVLGWQIPMDCQYCTRSVLHSARYIAPFGNDEATAPH